MVLGGTRDVLLRVKCLPVASHQCPGLLQKDFQNTIKPGLAEDVKTQIR